MVFVVKRFRWVLAGAVVRSVSRRMTNRSVDAATEELEARLPESLTRALNAAPGDLTRTGGSMIVAHRTARRAAGVSAKAAGATARGARTTSDAIGGARSAVRRVGETANRLSDESRRRLGEFEDQVAVETARAGREYRSAALRRQGETSAADEELLDRRPQDASPPTDPFETVPDPVQAGRRRSAPTARRVVERVKRTYRPRSKPWE